MREEIQGLDWSAGRMLPAFQPPSHLAIYDVRGASRDVRLTFASLVGLVNRPRPQVYVVAGEDDLFWLQHGLHAIAQTHVNAQNDAVLNALLQDYRHHVQGLILYDPALADSINIATMLAGQHDAIVVSPAQSASLQATYRLPIISDLRDYHWCSRLQAYQWALQNLLPRSSARLVAGFDPTNVDNLRSFLVATRTFIYWLDSRRYLPTLNDGLVSERCLMQRILTTFSPESVHLGWFIDESSGVGLTSHAALPVLASDHCTNLEVWTATQSIAIEQFAAQNEKRRDRQEEQVRAEKQVYVSFTLSEGDNLQYCQHRMQHLWSDQARGKVPIGWTISPVLKQAAPVLASYYQQTATANDEFIAGPSGAGYMFPAQWPRDQLKDYLLRTGQMMQAMHMALLEVLDADFLQSSGLPILPWLAFLKRSGMAFERGEGQRFYSEVLRAYGVRGILSGAGVPDNTLTIVDNLPIYRNLGLARSVTQAVRMLRRVAIHRVRPLFLNVYVLAWRMTPGNLVQVTQQLGEGYTYMLPGDLLALAVRSIA